MDVTPLEPALAALVAEAARRSGICWLRVGGRDHLVWHLWRPDDRGDALWVLGDGAEQPLPALPEGEPVVVVLRSPEARSRLVAWEASVAVVTPADPDWEAATAALVATRLNLPDPAAAVAGWAAGSRVLRLAPTGRVPEAPDLTSAAAPRSGRGRPAGPLR